MARKTIGSMMRGNIYAFIYGQEGVGKTRLAMSLSKVKGGLDVGYITAESSGPTSLISAGFSPDIACELLPPSGGDPFPPAVEAIKSFARDPKIHTIVVDGCTVICGRAVDHYGNGEGEKALGWEGWQAVLTGFRAIEVECEKASRAGKNVILTAWENEPKTADTMDGADIVEKGRPLLQGKAKTWLPGNCDIVARLTASFIPIPGSKSKEMQYKGTLQVHATEEWLAKTRWNLPQKCPANLQWILDRVEEQKKAASSGDQPKEKAPKGVALKVVKK
jgi:hypothetical protein